MNRAMYDPAKGPHMEYPMQISFVAFAVFGNAGLVANILQTLLLLRKRKNMSIFQLTLLSLSLTDTIAAILFAIGGNILAQVPAQGKGMPFTHPTLLFVRFFEDYFVLTSLFHVVFIALQRYAAVSFPLRYKTVCTKRRAVFILVSIWTVTLTLASVTVFVLGDEKLCWKIIACCFCFLDALLLLLYGLITHKISKQRKSMQQINAISQDNGFSVKLLVNSFGVTIMFILCTLPSAAGGIVEIGNTKSINLLLWSFLALKAFADPLFYLFINVCDLKYCEGNRFGDEANESMTMICKNQQ